MTSDTLTVLVLAVGGNVSQGILKALALSTLPCRVVGADIGPLKLGLYTTDRAYVSPWAKDPAFVPWVIEICRREGVNAILSGAEPVLRVLSRHAATIRDQTGARCIVSDPQILEIGDDKLRTCEWLTDHGFSCPDYARSEDSTGLDRLAAAWGFPLVAKPRTEGGSRGLFYVRDEADLRYAASKKAYIVQRHVGDDASEYTVGCFSDRDGRVRGVIVMRRTLHEGTTVDAEVGEFPEIREEARRLAEALRPLGPCNIQLRMAGGRVVVLELNIRFSGTTPVRARLGFNEVEAALRHFVLGEPACDLPVVTRGVMIRYWNEMYVAPDAYAALRDSGNLMDPKRYPLHVEDYGMRS